jgi:outer membrane biosynthesis protein TonB
MIFRFGGVISLPEHIRTHIRQKTIIMAFDTLVSREEPKNRQRSFIISVSIHVVLLFLLFASFLTFPDPPPGQEGILVNLGLPDQGQGDENASAGSPEIAEPEPEPKQEEAAPPKSEPASKPEPVKEKEVRVTEDPEAVALKRKQEQEKKAQAEADAKRKAEADAKVKAEADAKRKAAEEDARKKAEADKLKGEMGGLFGGGKGKGNTGTPGNQGDPNGDPNADKLTGVSTGVGKVGGGLGGRKVTDAPKIKDDSQDRGTVVLRVCVDAAGNVTSAAYTQAGSTATSAKLKDLAVSNAKRWKFGPGEDGQCGTITYNFTVQ